MNCATRGIDDAIREAGRAAARVNADDMQVYIAGDFNLRSDGMRDVMHDMNIDPFFPRDDYEFRQRGGPASEAGSEQQL